MLALVLRVLIVFELVCYTTLAVHFLGVSGLVAGLIAVSMLLGLRLSITVLTFAMAWTHRSPATRLGPMRVVGMLLAEWAAFVANFVLISPFEPAWMGADRLPPAKGRPPVLLLHGYGCSRAAWWWLRRQLEAAGWTVATINLEPVYTSIESYVDPLARRIEEVLAATGAGRLILVGHSMGGLVARAYLRRHGAGRVLRLVTLGTPHGGSELSRLGLGENGRQMVPGNAWLAALAQEPLPVDTLAIYSPHDNYVMPQSHLHLPGALHLPIDGLGHLAMMYSPRVAVALVNALQESVRSGDQDPVFPVLP